MSGLVFVIILLVFVLLFEVFIDRVYCLEYRLGDTIRLNSGYLNLLTPIRYPNSIARAYIQQRKFAEKNNPDLQTLKSIVQSRSTKSNAFVIHLRLGDVIELSHKTALDFWEKEEVIDSATDAIQLSNGVNIQWNGTNHGSNTSGYVKSKSYYEKILSAASLPLPRQVILIGGTHKSMKMPKSLEFVKIVKEFLENKGFEVSTRITKIPNQEEADKDFLMMANAKFFLPAGGGFSAIAAQLVDGFVLS